jgi:hypothetical protein
MAALLVYGLAKLFVVNPLLRPKMASHGSPAHAAAAAAAAAAATDATACAAGRGAAASPVKYYTEIDGDLLQASETYIVHQEHCKRIQRKESTVQARPNPKSGLSGKICYKWEHARVEHLVRQPGQVLVLGGRGSSSRGVIALMGQRQMGHEAAHERGSRSAWFEEGLAAIDAQVKDGTLSATAGAPLSFAFPHGIGCGLAGGVWGDYLDMINKFADVVRPCPVVIYKYVVDRKRAAAVKADAGEQGGEKKAKRTKAADKRTSAASSGMMCQRGCHFPRQCAADGGEWPYCCRTCGRGQGHGPGCTQYTT